MGIKSKTCDIRTCKKHLFLDISSTNIDTLVPSLYQCVETRSIKVFWRLSQPIPHLRFNLFVISETFATRVAISLPSCEPFYATNRKHFIINILFIESFCLQKKKYIRTLVFGDTPPQARSPFWLLKPASEHVHARLLPRPSWSWMCCYLVIHIENPLHIL
jgi:hypothetical protein